MKALDRFRAGVSGMAGGCRGWRAAAAAFALLLTMGMRPAAAQVAPAADAGGAHLSVGGAISGYVLGYGNVKLYGPSVFVDIDTLRHFGVEAEVRLLPYHAQEGILQTVYKEEHATTYMGGVRYFRTYGRLQPYVKGLVGLGQFTYPYKYATDNDLVVAPGAGMDYKLTNRIKVRGNFEYQLWPQFLYGQMESYGVDVGVRVKIF